MKKSVLFFSALIVTLASFTFFGWVIAFVSLAVGCFGLIASVHNFPERASVTSQRRFR